MRKKIIKSGLSAIVLAGCTILLFQYAQYSSSKSASVRESIEMSDARKSSNELVSARKSIGLPVRIKIPRIYVDAAIEHVGLTPQGAMDVPSGPNTAAWFELGPRPGEEGSAVIDGHFGWKNRTPAIFDNLHTLERGDKLYVEDEKGVTTTFMVRELRTYGEIEDISAAFASSDGKAHLNLITCQGVWNKTRKSYSQRLAVFTDKEME